MTPQEDRMEYTKADELNDLMNGHLDAQDAGEWEWLDSTRDLQRVAFDLDPDKDAENVAAQATRVKDNVLAAIVEMVEMLNEVKWKYWSHEEPWVRRQRVLEEAVDVNHFIANALVAVGVTDEEYEEAYQEKQRQNIKRQIDKYVSAQAEENR